MRKFGAGVITILCFISIAGCTTNKSIANVTTPPNKLQLAVGTINDSQDTLGIGGVSLNVVSTFLNVLGNSAYEHPGFYQLTGPNGTIVTPNPSNFCDQLFSYGDFPGCEGDNIGEAIVGVPPAYTPPSSIGGYSLGFIQTGAPATAGTYTLSTSVPANGTQSFSASATLGTTVMANAGGVTGFVSDTKGGGTFTFSNPLKAKFKLHHHGFVAVSEFLILVSNSVISSSPLIVAAVEAPGGRTTATIVGTGDCSSSVGGIPIPCGGNSAYVIDADYPLVEDGPPASHSQAPQLDGPNGSADISVSGITPINE